MRKCLSIALLFIISISMISWGVIGHQTVAKIAANHLTPKANVMVKGLLGNESMADVASWADQVLREPEYKNTAPQHYINVPVGLNYAEFKNEVAGQAKDNVYNAILKYEKILTSPAAPYEQKAEALKFIIHFVGDLHQPMHVSRAEDKGGNTIQLQFEGVGTNLHSLWDSKLIAKEGKSSEQMAIDYDRATPSQVKQWQSDELMKWLFESYQISTKLYTGIGQSNKLDDTYYRSHIGIIHERIEMAGIRLAGLLNRIAENYGADDLSRMLSAKATQGIVRVIDVKDAAQAAGQTVNITSKVYGYKEMEGLTLVNLGGTYPNQPLTIVLRGEAMGLAKEIRDKTISVTGKIEIFKDKPQIVVTDPKLIQISSQ